MESAIGWSLARYLVRSGLQYYGILFWTLRSDSGLLQQFPMFQIFLDQNLDVEYFQYDEPYSQQAAMIIFYI